MTEIIELKRDIDELRNFEKQATRKRNKDLFTIEISKLLSEVAKLEEKSKSNTVCSTNTSGSIVHSQNKRYEVKLNNYAWDQTEKFVKFYVTLKNVQSIPADNVKCKFTPRSMEMKIEDLDGKDYAFRITNFLKNINPDQCSWKIKKDKIIVSAAKISSDKWSHVTEWEKKANDHKLSDIDTNKSDPSQGLMSLMKNMYQEGDDEMKRTIAKAWTESQERGPPRH